METKDKELPFWAFQRGHAKLYEIDYTYANNQGDTIYHVRTLINCRMHPERNELVKIYSKDGNTAIAEHIMEELKEVKDMPMDDKKGCIMNIFRWKVDYER